MKRWQWKSRKGATLLFFAIALPVLLAMSALVIDVGELYVTKTQLQTAADQGALAGCQDISSGFPSEANASLNAANFAKTTPGRSTDTVVTTVTYTSGEKSVKVETSRQAELFFAKIFNKNIATVKAVAKAQVVAATGIPPGAPPFVIQAPTNIIWQGGPKNDSYSQPFYEKIHPVGATDFTYVDVVFQKPTSYSTYLNLLSNGYDKEITMQTKMYHISPAAGGKDSVESFASRLSAPGNTDVLQAQAGDARLMLIPIVTTLPTLTQTWTYSTNGLGIVGFIGFWFDAISFDGNTANETTTGTNVYVTVGYDSWGRPIRALRGLDTRTNTYPNFYARGRFVRVPLPVGSGTSIPGQQWYGTGSVKLVN